MSRDADQICYTIREAVARIERAFSSKSSVDAFEEQVAKDLLRLLPLPDELEKVPAINSVVFISRTTRYKLDARQLSALRRVLEKALA